jgi:hypothetical protein
MGVHHSTYYRWKERVDRWGSRPSFRVARVGRDLETAPGQHGLANPWFPRPPHSRIHAVAACGLPAKRPSGFRTGRFPRYRAHTGERTGERQRKPLHIVGFGDVSKTVKGASLSRVQIPPPPSQAPGSALAAPPGLHLLPVIYHSRAGRLAFDVDMREPGHRGQSFDLRRVVMRIDF